MVTELPHLNWPRVVATVPLEKDAMEGPFPLEDLALEDATGNNVGTVSAEIPVGPKWCEIRQARHFMILAMRLPIIQIEEARRQVTRCGKFIR